MKSIKKRSARLFLLGGVTISACGQTDLSGTGAVPKPAGSSANTSSTNSTHTPAATPDTGSSDASAKPDITTPAKEVTPGQVTIVTPNLTATAVPGFSATLGGSCDHVATHSATTTVGSVQNVSCDAAGNLKVLVHLPSGSAPFEVTVTSSLAGVSVNSDKVTFSRTSSACPSGFVGVPGSRIAKLGNANASNGNRSWWLDTSKDFCVMKYPAKNVSETPQSVPEGTPWTYATRQTAMQKCSALGTNYRLMSNTQWQTVARNSENVASNWKGGVVGQGSLARGHSDSEWTCTNTSRGEVCNYTDQSATNRVLANSTDNNPYFDTGNKSDQAVNSGWEQRRTHALSNNEIVWDFGGNVAQIVSDSFSDLSIGSDITIVKNAGSAAASYKEFSELPDGSITRLVFGPSANFNSSQNIGRIYTYFGLSSERRKIWSSNNTFGRGVIYRGGGFDSVGNAGLFAVHVYDDPTYPKGGFRCVYLP